MQQPPEGDTGPQNHNRGKKKEAAQKFSTFEPAPSYY
jgi:hypothetical protein